MYALDTNTLIHFFKGQGGVAKTLLSKNPKNIFIPSVVLYEFEVGIEKSSQPISKFQPFYDLIETCHLIDFGRAEGKASAIIRSDLEKKGTPIGPIDNLIAGSAFAHGLILVTHNTREFAKIKKLKLEDWY